MVRTLLALLVTGSALVAAAGAQAQAPVRGQGATPAPEARRFGENQELLKRFEEAERLRKEMTKAREGEESLIKKAANYLKKAKDLGTLKDLAQKVGELTREEEALLRGEDPSGQKPEADDSRALEDARSAVEGLRKEQEELNRELQKLAGGDTQEKTAGGEKSAGEKNAGEKNAGGEKAAGGGKAAQGEKTPAGEKNAGADGKIAEAVRQIGALLGELKNLQGETQKATGDASPPRPSQGGTDVPDSKKEAGPEIPPGDRERLSKAAEGIAGKINELPRSPEGKGSPQEAEAQKKLADAAAKLKEAGADLAKGHGKKALSGEEAARKDLGSAREALAVSSPAVSSPPLPP